MSSLLQRCLHLSRALLLEPRYFWYLAGLVIVGDALLTGLIIRYVQYTEIDWKTYMIQMKLVLKGEHNYTRITGPTGPLVYPAGHVQIHRLLHEFTDGGDNIQLAQYIYALLYILSTLLSCGIYSAAGNLPNWIVLLLPFSKRLHSIFVLRLFNDCWAVVVVQAAILAFQHGLYDFGVMLFSIALSVKMSILLYLPGLLVVLFKSRGLFRTLTYLGTIGLIQFLLARSFIETDPKAYIRLAFDLGRVFMYKWTVNWRFIDEETFLSRRLAMTLITGHVVILIAFGFSRWCKPDGGVFRVLSRGFLRPMYPAALASVTPDYVATVLFTSNLIGILFARSLHYQFYSWYAQQIPFLAWRTKYPLYVKLMLIFGIEYAWNIFPSTNTSSGVLLFCNALLLIGIWFGHSVGKDGEKVKEQ